MVDDRFFGFVGRLAEGLTDDAACVETAGVQAFRLFDGLFAVVRAETRMDLPASVLQIVNFKRDQLLTAHERP